MVDENSELRDIKVLMMAPCLGKFGGIEAFCLTLAEDLISRGAEVQILRKMVSGFHNDGTIERQEKEMQSSWSANLEKRYFSNFVKPRDQLIKKFLKKSDIVHLHNPLVEGVYWAKKENKPCVMTIYNWQRRGWYPRLLAWRWAVSKADRRWYISDFVWKSWEKKRKVFSDRLPVISRMPSGSILNSKRRGFLFVGRWVPKKGIRVLLEAYRIVSPDPKIWPLSLVGDGPLRQEVENFIHKFELTGVQIHGFVSEKERHKLTKNSKWMITPPHTQEDLGLTPLEARSVGVPCIASTDGGILETAGKHALFCIPGDVKSLAMCIKKAINMTEVDYAKRAFMAKEDLEDYVRPLDQYKTEYLKLLESR
ncbi:MAG: hypothetical protein CMC93_01085 [Flavobacteriaceae bacterium]|nr:hypothetical protein [Flavobacteriaceae bacterium]